MQSVEARSSPGRLLFSGACGVSMYLLYLDDSGAVGNASDKHLILAGLAVFERQHFWLSTSLDELAAHLRPDNPTSLEFRGSSMFGGSVQWRKIGKNQRLEAFSSALRILSDSPHVALFGAAIHKSAVSPDDPMEFAFEQLSSRFDQYLGRLYKKNNRQRGLIILDHSSYETSLQRLAREFRTDGHRWGALRNIAEVPMFVDSKATRMIQYADLVAYALRRYYENGDDKYFNIIASRFDSDGGVLHGLTHYTPKDAQCGCFACLNR